MDSDREYGVVSQQVQARTHLNRLMLNYITSMAVKCATNLGIPDKIHRHGKSITLHELTSALHLNPRKTHNLHQLMRLLVSEGLFAKTKRDEEEAYTLTQCSRLLLKETTPSLLGYAKLNLHPAFLEAWQSMGDWFVGEEATAFETAHGMTFFEFFHKDTTDARLFNEAMDSDSNCFNSLILGDCMPAFEGLDSLVDAGGGTGSLARAISESFPHLHCTVLDLPNVVSNLSGTEKLQYVGGDMFQSIPPTDAVVLKWVLHDWCDEDSVTILKNCKTAISEADKRGKVIIIDIVINEDITDEDESTKVKVYYDVSMMILFNGKERTEKEWNSLFMKAGFRHYKITSLSGFRSLIEVFP